MTEINGRQVSSATLHKHFNGFGKAGRTDISMKHFQTHFMSDINRAVLQ
jgi:hypothetical protein